jgi:hypothetical protein
VRRFLPLVFAPALAVPVAGAPQLRDRPLAPYERQVAEGLVVFGGPFGWVVVAEIRTGDDGRRFCMLRRLNGSEVQYEWLTTVPVWHVAEWLRDYPENRRAKR